MRFLYIAPIGAKIFVCRFFYKYNAPLELKSPDFVRFHKKPTLENFNKGE